MSLSPIQKNIPNIKQVGLRQDLCGKAYDRLL